MTHYNPERRAWRGRSYKKGGEHIQMLRQATLPLSEETEATEVCGLCGEHSTASLQGTAGWCWLKLGPGSRATVPCCPGCAKEKREGETILGCLLAAPGQ